MKTNKIESISSIKMNKNRTEPNQITKLNLMESKRTESNSIVSSKRDLLNFLC